MLCYLKGKFLIEPLSSELFWFLVSSQASVWWITTKYNTMNRMLFEPGVISIPCFSLSIYALTPHHWYKIFLWWWQLKYVKGSSHPIINIFCCLIMNSYSIVKALGTSKPNASCAYSGQRSNVTRFNTSNVNYTENV